MKYSVDYLDLVIIRSCNMACEGCCTFSDHQKINGLVDPEAAEPALEFFSKFIDPKRLHIFGGEPTMHPRLLDWIRLARKYWPISISPSGDKFPTPIWINTNGYYLDRLFDHIDEIFVDNLASVSVTYHTSDEPYSSLVLNNYQQLQSLILKKYQDKYSSKDWQWVAAPEWDSPYKKFIRLYNPTLDITTCLLNMTMQNDDKFVTHYKGHGALLEPWHDYRNQFAMLQNHENCHIKNYVQIYENKLWKCPPRAVLNHTLETYDLQQLDKWKDYYTDYKPLEMHSSDIEVDQWFQKQKDPEYTCNMCGFMYSQEYHETQQHLPKKPIKIYHK